MKIHDTIRDTIRKHLDLKPEHPIEDDWPLYSLGATPTDEISIVSDLATRFELPDKNLFILIFVGSALGTHTVPYLAERITEALTQ